MLSPLKHKPSGAVPSTVDSAPAFAVRHSYGLKRPGGTSYSQANLFARLDPKLRCAAYLDYLGELDRAGKLSHPIEAIVKFPGESKSDPGHPYSVTKKKSEILCQPTKRSDDPTNIDLRVSAGSATYNGKPVATLTKGEYEDLNSFLSTIVHYVEQGRRLQPKARVRPVPGV